MEGTGIPLATPFGRNGEIDEQKLRELVDWLTDNGVDFIVPCGSNSEAELMTLKERGRVTEIVVEASSQPVMAGVGHPGFKETKRQIDLAETAGADGVLVVTPFYYQHDQQTLIEYYRDVGDYSDLPVYLYSMPAFTGMALAPETVSEISAHDNICGIKDSSGDIQNLQRLIRHTPSDFDVFVGSGGVYAQGLEVGAAGGVLALSNVVPEKVSEVHTKISAGDFSGAHQLNKKLVDLNHAITSQYGVPGLKEAMRNRNLPAGQVRRPFCPVSKEEGEEIGLLVDDAT